MPFSDPVLIGRLCSLAGGDRRPSGLRLIDIAECAARRRENTRDTYVALLSLAQPCSGLRNSHAKLTSVRGR